MRWSLVTMAFVGLLSAAVEVRAAGDVDAAVEKLRADVCGVLAKLGPNPPDTKAAEQKLREQLAAVVAKDAAALRPKQETQRYVSADKMVVIVVGADGAAGSSGVTVDADDDQAKLVIGIGG